LGTHISGRRAARIIAALIEEGFTKAQIALWLGHRHPVLHWKAGARVTLRTLYAVQIIQRRVCT
jgi:hypothetical protein